jgi:small conductance mechanosensitive channel
MQDVERRDQEAAKAEALLRSTGERVELGLWDALQQLLLRIPNILAFALALAAAWLIGRLIAHMIHQRLARQDKSDLGRLIGTVAHWAIVLIIGLFAMTLLFPAIKAANVLSVLGIGSVAVGFVFKEILQNLLSGIIILVREPYTRGDEISVAGFEGVVEQVESRATHIRTIDQRMVTIPNATVFSDPVTVNTNLPYRMASHTLSIAYGEDPRQAMQVILEAVRSAEGVLEEPPPQIAVQELNDFAIDLYLVYAAPARESEQISTRGAVLLAILDACRAHGIEMPYPTQVNLLQPFDAEGSSSESFPGTLAPEAKGGPTGD